MKEFLRTIKFTIFSISAGIIQIGSFTLLNTFLKDWNYWPCYLISLLLSIIWNFTLNRKFTFKSAANVPIAMLKVLAYYAVFTPLTTYFGNYFVEVLGANEYIITVANMLLNFVTEYLYQRFFVFGKTIDTKEVTKNAKD